MSSRLGNPAPQARTGAARFAAPSAFETSKHKDVLTSNNKDGRKVKTEKQPMTIRLTMSGIDHLAELERSLRRAGMKARQASASEIVEALVHAATPESIRKLMDREKLLHGS